MGTAQVLSIYAWFNPCVCTVYGLHDEGLMGWLTDTSPLWVCMVVSEAVCGGLIDKNCCVFINDAC